MKKNRIEILSDIYNKLFDWCWPIYLLLFFGILFATGITHNENIFIIGSIIIILLVICSMIYFWLFPFEHLSERFTLWIHSFNKYKLNDEKEKILWTSLQVKAKNGYKEWYDKTLGDDLCGPWIKDYTEEEDKLLDKIHKYFYGENWYVVMPISGAQVNFVKYYDIKDKVI